MSSDEREDRKTEERSWTEGMRDFFQQTGSMRSEDVARLLGDQSKIIYMDGPVDGQSGNSRPLFG